MAATIEPRELITKFAKDNSAIPALQFIINDPEGIEIEDIIGYGMVNYVYRVSSKDKKQSVIIKYGEEQMRMAPAEKTPLERQVLEFDCLQLLHSIQPGRVPEPYCLDRNHNAMAMQDMKEWELLGSQLLKCQVDLEAATFLGEMLAKIHMKTTQGALGQEKWQQMVAKFSQEEARHYINAFMYIRPYNEKDEVNFIPDECLETYRNYVKQVEARGFIKKMRDLFDKEECFIHADCHQNSIFVKDGRTVLFDFEYAFLSSPASNLAWPLSSYLFYFLLEKINSSDPSADKETFDKAVTELRTPFMQGARNLVDGYLNVRTDLSGDQRETFLADLAMFVGGTIFMLSVFSCLNLFCKATVPERIALLDSGFKLLMRHEDVKTVDQLLNAMFDYEA